jgi:hypothetical protein
MSITAGAGHPYVTRLVRARPTAAGIQPAIVNGQRLRFDNEVDWFHSADPRERRCAWIGVSAQNVGVSAMAESGHLVAGRD